jgi:hypothetical protein
MYALTPTIFELLTVHLDPRNRFLAEMFPNIQYALLNALYLHCSKHEHFIANSAILMQRNSNSDNTNTQLYTNAQTRDHFKTIIELLIETIDHVSCTYDTSMLILNWFLEILEFLSVDFAFVMTNVLFTRLYNSIVNSGKSFTLSDVSNQVLCDHHINGPLRSVIIKSKLFATLNLHQPVSSFGPTG